MKQKQFRRNIGKFLKKIRQEKNMTLNEVVAYLSLHKIKCSRTNLSRLEDENATIRSDILAGLSVIYDINVDKILFRDSNK